MLVTWGPAPMGATLRKQVIPYFYSAGDTPKEIAG
jgi:hypothetical protein